MRPNVPTERPVAVSAALAALLCHKHSLTGPEKYET